MALAAGAMEAGDIDFSNLLSSIQTDEGRHAQCGFPVLDVRMKHAPKRAQHIFDVSFWRSFRLFQILTGTATDDCTPQSRRRRSYTVPRDIIPKKLIVRRHGHETSLSCITLSHGRCYSRKDIVQ